MKTLGQYATYTYMYTGKSKCVHCKLESATAYKTHRQWYIYIYIHVYILKLHRLEGGTWGDCRGECKYYTGRMYTHYYYYYYYYYYHYYYYYFILFYYYNIDGRIYLNLSSSIQSTAGPKVLKPAANGWNLLCKSLPYYLHLLYRSTFILLFIYINENFEMLKVQVNGPFVPKKEGSKLECQGKTDDN